ncbi:MAG TPA: hypothetical protein IAC99_06765 [Candidatus Choladocola avistercoris]|nr:hypothetical protein [Candidatus Choladocola avistercoris]
METLSRFLDFADSIIKKHSGFGYDYESAPMVYLEEEDPEPEGIREQKQYVTNLFQVTNLKEENYLYRQNLTFLTQILENRIYQPLYPGLEKQIERAVREEMPEARERVIRDFSREIRTLMKEGGTRQLEILKERLLPAQEEENSEQKEQTILFRKLENIYNSSIYATTVQQYYADRYPENRVLQPGGQTWSVFRESAGQSLAKRRERTEIVPEEPVHFDYPEEESAGQTYFLEKALAEARRQTGSIEQKISFLFQDAGNVLPRQRTDFLSLEYSEEARTQEYETEGRAAEKAGQETLSLSDAAARTGVQKEMPVQSANAERELTSQPGKPAEFPAAQEQQSREAKPASLGPADEKERNAWDDAIRRSLDFAREVEEKAELKREHADRAKEVSVRADTDIPIVYLEETGDRSDAERTPEKQPQASQPRREETPSRRMPEDPASARQMLQDTVSAQTTAQDEAVYRTSEGQEKSESALQDHIQKNREFTESVTGHTSVRADTDIPIVYLEETGDRSDAEGTPEKQLQASQPRREEISARRMPEDPASARQTPQDTVSAQTTAQDEAVHRTPEEQEKSEPALQDHIQRNREFTESVTRHASVRADADIPIVYLEETGDRSDAEGTPEKQLQASQPRGEEISARRMPEDTASARSTSEDTKSVRRMPEDTVSARQTPQDTVSVQTTAQGAKAVHRTSEEQEKSESALQDHIQRNREFTESVTRHADSMFHLSAETGKKEGAVFRRFEMAPAVLEYTRDETAQIRREIIETVLPEIRRGTVSAEPGMSPVLSGRLAGYGMEPSVILDRTVHETAEQILRGADAAAGHTGGKAAARSVALQQIEKVLADYAGNRAGAPETKEALETILRVYQVRVQSEEMMEHPGPLTAEKSGTGVRMKFPGEGVTLTMRPEPAAMVFARETDPKETQQETRRLKKEVEEIVTEIRTEKEKTVIHQEKLMERQKEIVREVITNQPSLLTEGKSGIQLARQMERALNLQLDKSVGRIADQVYRRLEERLKTERERRGFR